MKIADGLRVTQLSLRCRHLTDSVSVTAAALVGGDGLVGGGALLRGAVRARGLARHRSGGRTGPRGTRVTADRLERPGQARGEGVGSYFQSGEAYSRK